MKKIYLLILLLASAATAQAQDALGTYLRGIINRQEKGFFVTARLIEACGLLDSVDLQKDYMYRPDIFGGVSLGTGRYADVPETLNYGYTLFAETDGTWETLLGKTYRNITVEDIRNYVVKNSFYPEGTDNADYTDEKNVLNLFVTYHLLTRVLPPDRLVNHVNEPGFNPETPDVLTTPVCEYYVTMGKRRLLRAFESKESRGVYLNRFPILDNGRHGTYSEVACEPNATGIYIDKGKAVYAADNAVIYPIDRILVYDSNVRTLLAGTRMRHDFAAMYDELANNDIRLNRSGKQDKMFVCLPCDKSRYQNSFDGLMTNDCSLVYENFCSTGSSYPILNKDDIRVYGRCDVTFRLPPVPVSGTYEIRLGATGSNSTPSIIQVYAGSDPGQLHSAGIPVNFRKNMNTTEIGWTNDTGQEEADQMTDNELRYHGLMKAPNSIGYNNGSLRNQQTACRMILTTMAMAPDKTYYIRLKEVLDTSNSPMYIDYIEICPKNVYDSPNGPEDIW